jgi:C-terminal processing protease CtpA/Prc
MAMKPSLTLLLTLESLELPIETRVKWFRTALLVSGLAVLLLASSFSVSAQTRKPQPDITIDSAVRTEVIESVIKQLNEQYIFPETAKEIEKALRERVQRKEYDRITSAAELAKTLTTLLLEVSRDQHLSVNYSFEPLPVRARKSAPTAVEREGLRNYGEAINFGFEKVERLPANIGYLRLNLFFPAEYGAETAVAAMNFLANSEALIIDLRGNDGGDPDMVVLLASYLFGAEPVRLSDIHRREENATQQFWTLAYVPGKRYVDKDVYILTSKRTFSAAEAFTYDLKNLKRATVIGETTGGGANPRDVVRINEHFWIGLPTARAVSPVTKTNWEGTGVKPDVEVPAEQALKTAQLAVLKKRVAATTDETGINNLNKLIETLQKELDELKKKS